MEPFNHRGHAPFRLCPSAGRPHAGLPPSVPACVPAVVSLSGIPPSLPLGFPPPPLVLSQRGPVTQYVGVAPAFPAVPPASYSNAQSLFHPLQRHSLSTASSPHALHLSSHASPHAVCASSHVASRPALPRGSDFPVHANYLGDSGAACRSRWAAAHEAREERKGEGGRRETERREGRKEEGRDTRGSASSNLPLLPLQPPSHRSAAADSALLPPPQGLCPSRIAGVHTAGRSLAPSSRLLRHAPQDSLRHPTTRLPPPDPLPSSSSSSSSSLSSSSALSPSSSALRAYRAPGFLSRPARAGGVSSPRSFLGELNSSFCPERSPCSSACDTIQSFASGASGGRRRSRFSSSPFSVDDTLSSEAHAGPGENHSPRRSASLQSLSSLSSSPSESEIEEDLAGEEPRTRVGCPDTHVAPPACDSAFLAFSVPASASPPCPLSPPVATCLPSRVLGVPPQLPSASLLPSRAVSSFSSASSSTHDSAQGWLHAASPPREEFLKHCPSPRSCATAVVVVSDGEECSDSERCRAKDGDGERPQETRSPSPVSLSRRGLRDESSANGTETETCVSFDAVKSHADDAKDEGEAPPSPSHGSSGSAFAVSGHLTEEGSRPHGHSRTRRLTRRTSGNLPVSKASSSSSSSPSLSSASFSSSASSSSVFPSTSSVLPRPEFLSESSLLSSASVADPRCAPPLPPGHPRLRSWLSFRQLRVGRPSEKKRQFLLRGKKHLKVAVIGAGMAGISAARELRDAGVKSVVVYEARSRVGGRCCSAAVTAHPPRELASASSEAKASRENPGIENGGREEGAEAAQAAKDPKGVKGEEKGPLRACEPRGVLGECCDASTKSSGIEGSSSSPALSSSSACSSTSAVPSVSSSSASESGARVIPGIDLGASWIHGVDDNPVYAICLAHRLHPFGAARGVEVLDGSATFGGSKKKRKASQKAVEILTDAEEVLFDEATGARVDAEVDAWAYEAHQSHQREADSSARRDDGKNRGGRQWPAGLRGAQTELKTLLHQSLGGVLNAKMREAIRARRRQLAQPREERRNARKPRATPCTEEDQEPAAETPGTAEEKAREGEETDVEPGKEGDSVEGRLLMWHLNNLEYSAGADVDDLSLICWDQDDLTAFQGQHVLIWEGYKSAVEALTSDLDIRLRHEVSSISYADSGVTLRFADGTVSPRFDFCIVTLPLGVLKASVTADEQRATGEDAASFRSEVHAKDLPSQTLPARSLSTGRGNNKVSFLSREEEEKTSDTRAENGDAERVERSSEGLHWQEEAWRVPHSAATADALQEEGRTGGRNAGAERKAISRKEGQEDKIAEKRASRMEGNAGEEQGIELECKDLVDVRGTEETRGIPGEVRDGERGLSGFVCVENGDTRAGDSVVKAIEKSLLSPHSSLLSSEFNDPLLSSSASCRRNAAASAAGGAEPPDGDSGSGPLPVSLTSSCSSSLASSSLSSSPFSSFSSSFALPNGNCADGEAKLGRGCEHGDAEKEDKRDTGGNWCRPQDGDSSLPSSSSSSPLVCPSSLTAASSSAASLRLVEGRRADSSASTCLKSDACGDASAPVKAREAGCDLDVDAEIADALHDVPVDFTFPPDLLPFLISSQKRRGNGRRVCRKKALAQLRAAGGGCVKKAREPTQEAISSSGVRTPPPPGGDTPKDAQEGCEGARREGEERDAARTEVCASSSASSWFALSRERCKSRRGLVAFDPPLPEWKREAVKLLGMGNMNKVALVFESPFWLHEDEGDEEDDGEDGDEGKAEDGEQGEAEEARGPETLEGGRHGEDERERRGTEASWVARPGEEGDSSDRRGGSGGEGDRKREEESEKGGLTNAGGETRENGGRRGVEETEMRESTSEERMDTDSQGDEQRGREGEVGGNEDEMGGREGDVRKTGDTKEERDACGNFDESRTPWGPRSLPSDNGPLSSSLSVSQVSPPETSSQTACEWTCDDSGSRPGFVAPLCSLEFSFLTSSLPFPASSSSSGPCLASLPTPPFSSVSPASSSFPSSLSNASSSRSSSTLPASSSSPLPSAALAPPFASSPSSLLSSFSSSSSGPASASASSSPWLSFQTRSALRRCENPSGGKGGRGGEKGGGRSGRQRREKTKGSEAPERPQTDAREWRDETEEREEEDREANAKDRRSLRPRRERREQEKFSDSESRETKRRKTRKNRVKTVPRQRGWASREKGRYAQLVYLHPKPIILVLVPGTFSFLSEKRPKAELVCEALRVVAEIHEGRIEAPIRAFVSRWGKDPFARGSYSYLPPGTTGRDYDLLSYPVHHRLLFAGEHTIRPYPSTVHGACLSGRREAARILDWTTGLMEQRAFLKWFQHAEEGLWFSVDLSEMEAAPSYFEDCLEGPTAAEREEWFAGSIRCAFCGEAQTFQRPFIGCVSIPVSSHSPSASSTSPPCGVLAEKEDGKTSPDWLSQRGTQAPLLQAGEAIERTNQKQRRLRFAVHEDCCYYTPGVVSDSEGSRWFNVGRSILAASLNACACCGLPGASIPCAAADCSQALHLPCAQRELRWPRYETNSAVRPLLCPSHQCLLAVAFEGLSASPHALKDDAGEAETGETGDEARARREEEEKKAERRNVGMAVTSASASACIAASLSLAAGLRSACDLSSSGLAKRENSRVLRRREGPEQEVGEMRKKTGETEEKTSMETETHPVIISDGEESEESVRRVLRTPGDQNRSRLPPFLAASLSSTRPSLSNMSHSGRHRLSPHAPFSSQGSHSSFAPLSSLPSLSSLASLSSLSSFSSHASLPFQSSLPSGFSSSPSFGRACAPRRPAFPAFAFTATAAAHRGRILCEDVKPLEGERGRTHVQSAGREETNLTSELRCLLRRLERAVECLQGPSEAKRGRAGERDKTVTVIDVDDVSVHNRRDRRTTIDLEDA
ncbi:UNVERIFIED_CONTAM: histone lysine-specific demethylase LSD1/BHC110/KDMA1A [Hammondia hammondi]|eukprot:XP_008886615.1 histone lysine-specific demethylase LSD1/BHC110/KDMA1A [Hammondia hammondi]